MSQAAVPPPPVPPQASATASPPAASGPIAAELAARLAPLVEGLGLTEAEILSLGVDLLEELLSDDPEVMRARVADVKAARAHGA